MMDKQERFHSVDEQVISPLHSGLIQPEDSVSQTGSNFVIKLVKEEKGRPN